MARKNVKRYLTLLAVVGLVATAAGTGTFASFNAEVTNAGNTFQTGSITLGNQVASGTVCYSSEGAANNANSGCDAIFEAVDWQPGDTPTEQQLTLSNTGSLDPAALTFYAPLVATDGTPDAGGKVCNFESYTPTGATGTQYSGSGDPCAALEIQIQEYTDSTFATPETTCAFPANASAACGSSYEALENLPAAGSAVTIDGGLDSGTSRYFKLVVKYPDENGSADNEFQALKTHFNLTWHIE